MIFNLISGLVYANNIYHTYKTGNELYHKYRLPIKFLYTYTRRKYYKY